MIFLPQVDSTNIYAIQRINDGLSVHGEVIWTHHQTQGKGQRSKNWEDESGKSVLMSMVLLEKIDQMELFQLNAIVALAVREVLESYIAGKKISIKWPNDIFINDKKACGILIENSFRGAHWYASVIGIGVNVLQKDFDITLPYATSLYIESGNEFELSTIIEAIQQSVLDLLAYYANDNKALLEIYNRHLYKVGQDCDFIIAENESCKSFKILGVNADGLLLLKQGNEVSQFAFGSLQWVLK